MDSQLVPKPDSPSENVSGPELRRVTRIISDPIVNDPISLVEIWHILVKRKKIIVLCVCAALALALGYTCLTTPKYLATSSVEFNKANTDDLALDDVRATEGDTGAADYYVTQQTQIEALESDTLALQVIRELGLERRPEFASKQSLSDYFHHYPDESRQPLETATHRRANVLRAYHKNLRVEPVSGTRLISVQFMNPDPGVAASVVNTLVSDYMDQYYQIRVSATMHASDWLSHQLDDLKSQVETSQEKLVDYQQQAGILGTDENHNIVMTRLEEVDHQLVTAEANRILAQTVWQLAKNGNPELISGLVGTPGAGVSIAMPSSLALIENLRLQESQVRGDYAQAAAKYGSAYPKLVQMQDQIKELDDNIQTELANVTGRAENDYLAAQQTEDALRSSFEQEKVEANKLNDSAVQYTILKHEVESSRDLYDGLLKKLKEAGVLAGLRSTNIVVVDPARPADKPTSPSISLNAAAGLFGGLLLGVFAAFVVDNFDQTINTPDQAEEVSLVPSLGYVPQWKALHKSRKKTKSKEMGLVSTSAGIFVISQPQSQIAEAYRAIRTSVMQVTRRGQSAVLMVTSAVPEEGKTTTSLNLAGALAQQGANVLLVEADMRRPQIRQLLGLTSPGGLSSMIAMQPQSDMPAHLPSIPKLSIIPAGSRPSCPAELLGSPRMADLIKEWRSEYDYIVIDSPPVLSVTDAAVLAPLCDAAVLVVRAGVTTKQSVLRVKDIFARMRTRIAGVVVNSFDPNSVDHRYYFGYKSTPENGRGYYTPSAN